MDLLLEIGNTRLKWAWWHEGHRTPQQAVMHEGELPDEVQGEWRGRERPARVFIANVAGAEMARSCRRWMWNEWRLEPLFLVSQREQMGVVNAYREPHALGIDRWLALIAAYHVHRKTLLIVDAGSAITFDVLDAGGIHRGGLILPGLRMMHDMLIANTSLPPLEVGEPADLLGTDTASAVSNGAIHAVLALIEKMAGSLSMEGEMETVITGGDASTLHCQLACPAIVQPELVMDGLTLVAEQTL